MLSRIHSLLKSLGPGLVTGAADDDPAGIATYAQTGAKAGFQLLWSPLFLLPALVAVQELASRIAIVTKQGLTSNMRRRSPLVASIMALMLCLANVFNIGADINMMSATIGLVLPFHATLLTLLVLTIVIGLEIFLDLKRFTVILKWFVMCLLAYIAVLFYIQVPWKAVISSIALPSLPATTETWYLLVACIGTTISPYLYFWQADEEIEEKIQKRTMQKRLSLMRIDTVAGMLFGCVIAISIMIVAATLSQNTHADITTPAQLAQLLEPLVGKWATMLFLIGVLSSGLLAIPVLAGSAGFAFAEAFGWEAGIRKKWYEAKGFYVIIAMATLLGVALSLLKINPIQMLVQSAIFNAIVSVPTLSAMLLLANSKQAMKEHTNTMLSNGIILFTLVLLVIGIIFTFAA